MQTINTTTRSQYLNQVKKIIPQKPTCVEVGVLRGNFSELILSHLNPKKLHLVDPWERGADKNSPATHYSGGRARIPTAYSTNDQYQLVKSKFNNQIQSKSVVLHRGYSYDCVESFDDNYFDFIYIDACHLYESVKADLEMFLPKLKTNGLMCGHDYFNDPKGSNFGVIQAVDEFCEKFNFQMIIFNNPSFDWALMQK